ncbi:MAG: hypothetical protein M3Q48_06840 [Actinomycetota bacterium]|nr:hypothetical protein [Actinomycetota bacterium]
MPWCDECSRFLPPANVGEAAECPGCGTVVGGDDVPKVPWHFKLLVVATVAYLAWRALQGVAWVVGRL